MAKNWFGFLKPAHNDDILDWFEDDKSIVNRYVGSEAFIHAQIYQKLVQVLSVVLDGYPEGTYTFLPVDEELDDLYQQLRRKLMDIEEKLNITHLRIMDFKAIPSLNGNFQYLIGLWHFGKMMYLQDQERLLKLVKHDIVSDHLKLQFINLDKYLKAHKVSKLKLLGGELNPDIVQYAGIQFDTSMATLRYADSDWFTVQVNQKEMQYLRMLVDAKGKVIDYQTIARRLNLNAAHKQATNEELARIVQFLKRDLGKTLKEVGMSKVDTSSILDSIVSIRGLGYKLVHLR